MNDGTKLPRLERGRDRDLRVHGRAGPAARGLGVAADAAIEVEARPEPFLHSLRLFEVVPALREETRSRMSVRPATGPPAPPRLPANGGNGSDESGWLEGI